MDTAPTEIYTLSYTTLFRSTTGTRDEPGTVLLTLGGAVARPGVVEVPIGVPLGIVLSAAGATDARYLVDRKSTRLNSSHMSISYAVFCLKKKNTPHHTIANK